MGLGMGAGLGRDWYILGGWLGWEKDLLVVLGWAGLPGLDWERKRGMRMDAVAYCGVGLGRAGYSNLIAGSRE